MDRILTLEEFDAVKSFMLNIAGEIKPDPDWGSCIIGNCIEALVIPPRCRKAQYWRVFGNCWTQGEQERALREMMKRAEERFPSIAGKLYYNCGRMD